MIPKIQIYRCPEVPMKDVISLLNGNTFFKAFTNPDLKRIEKEMKRYCATEVDDAYAKQEAPKKLLEHEKIRQRYNSSRIDLLEMLNWTSAQFEEEVLKRSPIGSQQGISGLHLPAMNQLRQEIKYEFLWNHLPDCDDCYERSTKVLERLLDLQKEPDIEQINQTYFDGALCVGSRF